MPSTFQPVGAALPPRRDQVTAAAEQPAQSYGDLDASINVPRARDRMLEFFEREQLPGDVKSTLAAALNGDLHYQHLLFIAMIDSWPKLQSNLNEIAREVAIAPWKIIPFAKRGEDPTPEAEDLAKECEDIVWRMRPDVKRGENDLEGMIANFATSYFMGHGVEEPRWEQSKDGTWRIRATKPLAARYYGYPYGTRTDDDEDRLMLDPEGSFGTRHYVDFPDNRFLIGINKGHAGHASTAAPLRALAAYWLAAVYGLKWFMNFTQLYGIPWRHAEVADKTQDNTVARSLAEIGSRGYIITRTGTKINVLESSKGGGNSLPQRELIDLADNQCDTFILGQTLTSGTDGSGSRALGQVHENTRTGRVNAVADYVGRILTYQLLPAIVEVNWGERDDIPEMWAKHETAKDEQGKAERMEVLARLNLPMSKSYVYEDLGVPIPDDADELFQPAPNGAQEDPAASAVKPTGDGLEPIKETVPGKSVAAAYDPNQPRVPKGEPTGGEWNDDPAYGGDGVPWNVSRKLKKQEDERIDRESGNDTPAKANKTADPELEKARQEYENSRMEDAMADFPEIGAEMKGKLPRPEDMDAGDPMRSEVQLVWDRFRKETRKRNNAGQRVIAPGGAASYFAPKGSNVRLDALREEMNEQGFEFSTPSDMIHSVYESLEGRKSWGTSSRGEGTGIAAAASDPDVQALIERMRQATEEGLTDADSIGAMLAAAWIRGAKED